ncbi:hypothetical protein KA005_44690 [bacterium]|nr:hypothetical protein [bacterium]
MKKLTWKVIMISLPILGICMYYLASWIPLIPVAYRHVVHLREEKAGTKTEEWIKKRRAYLESLEEPKLSGEEVAAILKKEKGIKTRELYDMADWYVYNGDEDVIKQIIANRQFEMKISLPEERGEKAVGTHTNYTVYEGYNGPYWNTDIEKLVHHQEMYRYVAREDTDPHFIYYLIAIAPGNDKKNLKKNSYFQQVFHDDILTYIRVYVNYKDWPTIKEYAKNEIIDYLCDWRDWDTLDEVLKIADEKGAKSAYELYMQRYQNNYQRFSGEMGGYNDWKKRYKYESVFQGWSSENVRGKTRIYKVDSDEAVIGIRNVQKILSVLRDGEDITSLCDLTAENVMIIPLKAGEIVELQYRINVAPGWWRHYYN